MIEGRRREHTVSLNHLNPTVPDVARTREFFDTYFGIRCVFERGRNTLTVLTDKSGFILTLSNFENATEVSYPGAFHLGFTQESPQQVDEMHERLMAGGAGAIVGSAAGSSRLPSGQSRPGIAATRMGDSF